MEVVLNDYAIAGQFRNIEDFVDSLVENTFPVLDCLRNKSTILWKSQETYSKYGEQPNCFSEALERDGVTVSFEHKDFMVDEVYIKKNRNKSKRHRQHLTT